MQSRKLLVKIPKLTLVQNQIIDTYRTESLVLTSENELSYQKELNLIWKPFFFIKKTENGSFQK